MKWTQSLVWASCVALVGCSQGFSPAGGDVAGAGGATGEGGSSRAAPFSAQLQCGLLPISVTGQGDRMQVSVRGEQIPMSQAISASGARYVADTDADTSLWFKGENATLVLNDMPYPECAPAGALVEPFRASGNEPFWSLALHLGTARLDRLTEGESPPQSFLYDKATGRFQSDGEISMTGEITDALCHDTMTGMPYPHRVTLQVDGTSLNGCGGDPGRLLQGAEWLVSEIDGDPVLDGSQITLNFWSDGRLSGRTSCNNMIGQYQISGEGLSIGPAATTRMACEPALMTQEQTVLETLQGVQRFDVDDTGKLILHSTSGVLTAHLRDG